MYCMFYWSLNVCPQPLLLTGHHGEISAMTFGKGSGPVLLCSASADYIIVWDIELCQKRTQEGEEIVLCWLKCVQCTLWSVVFNVSLIQRCLCYSH